jgi:hypothetical protein
LHTKFSDYAKGYCSITTLTDQLPDRYDSGGLFAMIFTRLLFAILPMDAIEIDRQFSDSNRVF